MNKLDALHELRDMLKPFAADAVDKDLDLLIPLAVDAQKFIDALDSAIENLEVRDDG